MVSINKYEILNAQYNSESDEEQYSVMLSDEKKNMKLPKGFPMTSPLYVGTPVDIEDE
jgi:hypothetical protein